VSRANASGIAGTWFAVADTRHRLTITADHPLIARIMFEQCCRFAKVSGASKRVNGGARNIVN